MFSLFQNNICNICVSYFASYIRYVTIHHNLAYRSATRTFSFHNKLFIILQTSAQILSAQAGLAHRLRARLKATLFCRYIDSKSICRVFSMNLRRQTQQYYILYERQLHGDVKPFLLSRVRFAAMVLPFMRYEYFARVIGTAVAARMQALVATNVMPKAITEA